MLKLTDIYLNFRGKKVIENSSITIFNNQIIVLSGESGSGKTSLLSDIVLISNHSQKNYYIDNQNVNNLSQIKKNEFKRNKVAYVSQNPQVIMSMTAIENFKFICKICGTSFKRENVDLILKALNLSIDLNTPVHNYSGGEIQRLCIACALMKNTPFIVMDEPTAYLDKKNIQLFINLIQKLRDDYEKTILIASHNKELIDICDTNYHIENNKIICKKSNAKTDKIQYINSRHPICYKDFTEFLNNHLKSGQLKNNMIRIFLSILLTVGCFIGLFLNRYQEKVNKELLNSVSSQIIIKTNDVNINDIISILYTFDDVEEVERYSFLMTEDNYVIAPYLAEDYFEKSILKTYPKKNKIFANFNIYKENNKSKLNIKVNNEIMSIDINHYLNSFFQDYKYNTDASKIIYVSNDRYKDLIAKFDVYENKSQLLIVKIRDKAYYEKVVTDIYENDKVGEVVGQTNLIELLKIKSKFSLFSNVITKSILYMMCASVIILKMIDLYKTIKDFSILDINGVPKRITNLLILKKEFIIICYPILISFVLVTIFMRIMCLLDVNLLFEIFYTLIIFMIIYLIFNYIIFYLLKIVFPVKNLIKK